MGWRAARSLLVLFDQLDVLAPGRSTASDGTIGDAAHASTRSDHNPDAAGVVRAGDYTHDPRHGADMATVAERLRTSKDRRITYVIFNRRIFSGPAGQSPWTWRSYTGDNPHTSHMHLSVVATAAADDRTPWQIGAATMADNYGRYGRPPHGVADRTTAVMLADLWWQELAGVSPYDGRSPSRRTAQLNQIAADIAAVKAAAAADETRDKAVLAAVEALATAGGVDAAPIVAAVTAVRDDARLQFAALHEEISRLQAALTEAEADRQALQARLAAALTDAEPEPDR